MGIVQIVERLMLPLKRRVLLMIGRAVLTLVNDQLQMQSVQVEGLSGETLDGVERFQQYGFTSHPHPGAEVLLLSLGGMRQHPVAAAIDDRRYRVKDLEQGEVCFYTDENEVDEPHRVTLRRDRLIELKAQTIRLETGSSTIVMDDDGVTITAPQIDLN